MSPPSRSRRHLALYLPQLALDRWSRREDSRLSGPFAVTCTRGSADGILCPNPVARESGVRADMSLTNARAVCPDLLTEPQDSLREERLLGALHRWADRYSPRVALEPPDGLAVDISGCAHLFGGERAMAEAMLDDMADLKVTARIGIGNTRRAARGFARHGEQTVTASDPQAEPAQIAALPLAALELEPKTLMELRRLGLSTIGELSAFKSSELARRFSVHLTDALDALRGHRSDPVVPSSRPPVFAAQMTLPEPVMRLDGITAILGRLAERVCARLHDQGYAARGMALTVRSVDTGDHELRIGFASPTQDTAPILRQFVRPLESLELAFGADWFRLLALDTDIFRHGQLRMGQAEDAMQDALDQTLTTLGNRLGFDRLFVPIAGHGHTPERERAFRPAVDAPVRKDAPRLTRYPRPELTYAPERLHIIRPGVPPQRFQWRREVFELRRADGPERVSPVWWDVSEAALENRTRDYWRAVTQDGRCLWLMVLAGQPERGWWLCGEFLRVPHFSLDAVTRAS